MYKEFFGLSEAPFSISPNPKFFYLSRHHREALASLKHGTGESGGFVLFTGEVGTGKTVIVRTLIEGLPPEIKYAAIYNPDLSINEMLEAICQGFSIEFTPGASKRELLDHINEFLLACANEKKRAVLLIDEAQHLSDEVLEQVRLLTNFETNNTKLLQVVLVGQPELASKLRQQHLRQLAQRITARFHLLPLTVTEVDSYVRFRLQSAGCLQVIFTRGAVDKLFHYSNGIPRMINVIADRALLAAFVDHSHSVEAKHVKQAAQEVLGLESLGTSTKNKLQQILWATSFVKYAVLGIAGLGLGLGSGFIVNALDHTPLRTKVVEILKQDAELIEAKGAYSQAQTKNVDNAIFKRERARYEADVLNSTLEETSWRNLIREWGFVDNTMDNGGNIEDSCRDLAGRGFRCLAARGSLSELERYNVPAVIQIMDDNLSPFYAVLSGLSQDYAVLLLNGREWVVGRTWLESAMEGDFRLIWPLPGGEDMVKATSNKESQAALSRMLAGYFMDSSLSFNGWNSAIAQKVREVQTNNGLRVDGIAGVDTLWVLLPFADTGHPLKRADIKPVGDAELNRAGAMALLNRDVKARNNVDDGAISSSAASLDMANTEFATDAEASSNLEAAKNSEKLDFEDTNELEDDGGIDAYGAVAREEATSQKASLVKKKGARNVNQTSEASSSKAQVAEESTDISLDEIM